MHTVSEATELWLVRHPQTDWNRSMRFQSVTDRPLSEEGGRQRAAIARYFSETKLSLIVGTGLERTSSVARAIGERGHAGVPVRDEPRFRELSHGGWEGLNWAKVKKQFPEQAFRRYEDPLEFREHGGESLMDGWKRIEPAWNELLAANDGGRIVLVTHGGPIQLLLCALLGLELTNHWRFRTDCAGITHLGLYPMGAIVNTMNVMPAGS